MVRSMTGFGRASLEIDGQTITAEVSSVNHRFFDCTFRLPQNCAGFEAVLREIVREHIGRGKVYVGIRRDQPANGGIRVNYNVELAKQYIAASGKLAALMGSKERLSLDVLAQLEGVFYQEESAEDSQKLLDALECALFEALRQFTAARETEGRALAADAAARLTAMDAALASVEARLPAIEAAYTERLRNRLHELTTDIEVKEDRVALELALLADKSAVHEEVVRLRAHLLRGHELLGSTEAVGRDLNFLTQEIQREINTLGSKLRDVGVIQEVLRMKSELEKLREQVQNIE